MSDHVVRGELWEHSPGDPGSWHFVTLPLELAEDIRVEAGPARGFGSVRVEARAGATTWRTSLFPEAGTGAFVLPVKKSVREAEGLYAGATCEIILALLT